MLLDATAIDLEREMSWLQGPGHRGHLDSQTQVLKPLRVFAPVSEPASEPESSATSWHSALSRLSDVIDRSDGDIEGEGGQRTLLEARVAALEARLQLLEESVHVKSGGSGGDDEVSREKGGGPSSHSAALGSALLRSEAITSYVLHPAGPEGVERRLATAGGSGALDLETEVAELRVQLAALCHLNAKKDAVILELVRELDHVD